jgi:hypothetical protein
MIAHGFSAADIEAARRAKGKTFFPVQVEGFDRRDTVFEVIGLKEPPSFGHAINYRLTILSAPPTHHDPKLESDAQAFVQTQLDCHVLSRESGDNDDASSRPFAHFLDIVKKRIEEAHDDGAH